VPQDGSPWHDPQARLLRFTLAALAPGEEDLHVVLNMSERAVDVPLPWVPGRQWHMAVDTAIASPFDVSAREQQRSATSVFPYSEAAQRDRAGRPVMTSANDGARRTRHGE